MKRKIDLYALKLRSSTPQKYPHKRKLSLSKDFSNNYRQPAPPIHIIQLTNYEPTHY